MNYEKKYKEALECIQEVLSSGQESIQMSRLKLRLQPFFHELQESEDERIRQALVGMVNQNVRNGYETFKGVKNSEMLAWLEKQGKYPQFTFDDVLAIQCCMEIVKKVQKDEGWYKQLQSLHGRVYDACHLENQEEEEHQ